MVKIAADCGGRGTDAVHKIGYQSHDRIVARECARANERA
jgi:hypothetical protein